MNSEFTNGGRKPGRPELKDQLKEFWPKRRKKNISSFIICWQEIEFLLKRKIKRMEMIIRKEWKKLEINKKKPKALLFVWMIRIWPCETLRNDVKRLTKLEKEFRVVKRLFAQPGCNIFLPNRSYVWPFYASAFKRFHVHSPKYKKHNFQNSINSHSSSAFRIQDWRK